MSRLPSRQSEIAAVLRDWEEGRLSRRSLIRRAAALGLGASALAVLLGQPGNARAAAAAMRAAQTDPAAGTPGGTLRVATIGDPPHLDEHQSTAEIIAIIGFCAYEGLFTYDANYQPIPELVETHTVSEDGLTHTMALRKGVMFHNGAPLTAADAIASVERWGRISGVGKRLMETSRLAEPRIDDADAQVHAERAVRAALLIALAGQHRRPARSTPKSEPRRRPADDPCTDAAIHPHRSRTGSVEWQRDARSAASASTSTSRPRATHRG
jgi:hypothetical protein